MNEISRLFRFAIHPLLAGTLLVAFSPCLRAQALSQSSSGANHAAIHTNGASPNSSAAESLDPQSPGNGVATPVQIPGPTTVGNANNPCDLISGPLTCLNDVLHDQRGIWTAPARIRGRKLLWLVPFATATTLALVYDARAMNALGSSPTRVRVSNDFTHLGSGYVLAGAAGATYLLGKLEHHEGPREAGILALESLADASLVVEGLKLATNRQRPYVPPGTGKFWPDDTDVYSFSSSFPSGHSAAGFAFARVMVEETPGHPWLHVLFYGLAASVAMARVTGENHFPSDALVGSVIGYSIGGYVYHHHSAFYMPKTKALRVEPLYNPGTASYGVSVFLQP
jgi:membrane-associated phospholipid phosphatase